MFVRDATDDDWCDIARIADEHGLQGADSVRNPRYCELLRDHGRLLITEDAGQVVGFAGMVRIGNTAMVSDLFVAADHQRHGVGTTLLSQLVGGEQTLMTFSSSHPGALAAYRRLGLQPGWALCYLQGPIVRQRCSLNATRVDPHAFVIDRPELLRLFDSVACVHINSDSTRVGSAIVADPEGEPVLHRLVLDDRHDEGMLAVMNILPAGAMLRATVPDWSSAYRLLRGLGFAETDHDLYMGTKSNLVPRSLAAVNPGLA
ncbi:MAG: GNAT family N-acetyltransferase [Acidimicrobiales bacterium]